MGGCAGYDYDFGEAGFGGGCEVRGGFVFDAGGFPEVGDEGLWGVAYESRLIMEYNERVGDTCERRVRGCT